MKVTSSFDFDVVALQQKDTLTALIAFEAPITLADTSRPGECLIPILDTSGSMQGESMDSCKQALHTLVDRMKPQDLFGLVTFSNEAHIQVPTRSIKDHDLDVVHRLIDSIHPEGSTDLSAGYLLGLDQARRNVQQTGASIILLSDGPDSEYSPLRGDVSPSHVCCTPRREHSSIPLIEVKLGPKPKGGACIFTKTGSTVSRKL